MCTAGFTWNERKKKKNISRHSVWPFNNRRLCFQTLKYFILFLPGIDGSEFHVHIMNRCKNVGGSLDDALAGLRHGDRRASGDQHRFVARAQRQVGHKVALDKDHLSRTASGNKTKEKTKTKSSIRIKNEKKNGTFKILKGEIPSMQ